MPSTFELNGCLIDFTVSDHINLFIPDNLIKIRQLNRSRIITIGPGWMGRAEVDINKAADILAATFEESDEKCDRTERLRDTSFVDSSADGEGFIRDCCYI